MNLLRMNSLIFPFLVGITFLLLGIETYTYLGSLQKHFFINTRLILAITILSAIIITNKKNIIFKLNRYVFPLLLIFYLILIFFEVRFYPNYIFSSFHIQPQVFLYLVVFSGLLLIVKDFNYKLSVATTRNKMFIPKILITLILIYLLVEGSLRVLNQAIYSDFGMLTHIKFTYDDKMRTMWGDYYDYAKFVSMYTGKDSSILVPPQEFNSTAGNVGLDRYFLYPRNLGNGGYNELLIAGYDYVLLTPGWPKVKIPANKILYFDPDAYGVNEVEGNYDPSKVPAGSWGIIEIKK